MSTLPMTRMMAVLWRQAVLRRRSQGSLWLTWMLLGLLVLLCLAPIAGGDPKLMMLPAIPLGCLAILWSVVFTGFCSQQYWERTAGLVPGLRSGIRRISIMLTLLVPALLGSALGILFGNPVIWIAGLLVSISCGMRWGTLIFLVLQFAVPVEVLPLLLTPIGQAVALAIALPLWWFRIQWKYPRSDVVVASATEQSQHASWVTQAFPGIYVLFKVWLLRLYARDLQRDIGSGRELAIHVIGKTGHWSASLEVLVTPGLVVAVLLAMPDFRMEDPYLLVLQSLLVASMWLLGLAKVQQMVQGLADTVGEQGVLRLAPGIQAGSALTREIVGTMWKRWLVWWLASTAGVMIALAARFESLERALCTVALLSASLVMSALLVRDYTKSFKPMELGSWPFIGLMLLTWVLLGAFFLFREYVATVSWAWLILLNVSAATIVLLARWRALERAPQIFPVARFA